MSELLDSFQLMIIVIILLLITRIFIALGVYFDADSKGLKNKSLFGVMTFFFGIIMLIIYLCIRNSAERVQPKVCNRCHNIVHPAVKFCPKCNTAFFTYYQIPDLKNKKLKSNSFFILAVVFFIAGCIYSYVVTDYFWNSIDKFADEFDDKYIEDYDESHSFSMDEFEDYFEQYESDE